MRCIYFRILRCCEQQSPTKRMRCIWGTALTSPTIRTFSCVVCPCKIQMSVLHQLHCYSARCGVTCRRTKSISVFFLARPFIPLIYSRVSYYTSAFWSSWNPQCANQRHQCSPTLCNFFYLQISVHFGFVCSKCSKFGDVIWNEHTGIVFCYNLLSLSKFKWYAILFLCVTHSGGGDSWPINMNDIEFMELANPINTERSFGGRPH